MTVHLYYDDSYLTEFSATVLEERHIDGHPAVILDRTAFYPTSGGQPHDVGNLGGARILNVEEDLSGAIVHIMNYQIPPGPVTGSVDWNRRFDHMQQHTGQHVLSQAFIQVAHAATLSFHLGQETCTIDLDLQQPSDSLIALAEDLASSLVFENRPVRVLTAKREELSALGVRKESQREGDIRIIEVENFDRSPCGGTHVRRTGELGIIAILGYERYKGGTRIEFVCGRRALRELRSDREILKQLGRQFSAHPAELPRLADKILEERAAIGRENLRLQNELMAFEARELVEQAARRQGVAVVRKCYSDRNLESIRLLAQKIAAQPGGVAILGLIQDTALVVAAKNKEVSGNCGAAVKQVIAKLGGKGGGSPELAQAGGVARESLESWLQALEDVLLPSQASETSQMTSDK